MRTTVTIDDDLVPELRRFMKSTDKGFKEALNDLLRHGLSALRTAKRSLPPYRVKPFSSPFQPGIDPLKLNQLVDELDLEMVRAAHGDCGDG